MSEEENVPEDEYSAEGGVDEEGNILTPDEMWEDEDNVTDLSEEEE